MKTFFSLALVVMLSLLSACDGPIDPTIGKIDGTINLAAGMTLDLSNARVAIYRTVDDLMEDDVLQSATVTGSASQWKFTFNGVTPGSYYLDVCKVGMGCIVYTGSGTQPALVPVEGGKVTTVTINVSPL